MRPAPTSPANPDDLAGADRELDVAEAPTPRQATDLEEDVADRRLDLREQRDGPTDHVPDEVGGRQLAGPRRDDVLAVAEDRRPVAQVEDLVEAVADEEHRDTAIAKPPDDREEARHLVGRERGSRFVEDEHPSLDRQRLRDLDQLLVGHRQAADGRVDVELHLELIEQGLGRAPRGTPVDRAEATGRGVADEDVLGDRQVREEPRLLVDDCDPQRASVRRAGDLHRFTVEPDRPAVGLMDAGEDLDQRALAGAVLADQRVDFTGKEVERDVVERLRRREPLGDPAQLGPWRGGHGRGGDCGLRRRQAVGPGEPGAADGPSSRTSTPRAVRAWTIASGAPRSVSTTSISSVGQNVANATRSHFV